MDALLSRINSPRKKQLTPVVLLSDSDSEDYETTLLSLTNQKAKKQKQESENSSDDLLEMTDILTELSESGNESMPKTPPKQPKKEPTESFQTAKLTLLISPANTPPLRTIKRSPSHINLEETPAKRKCVGTPPKVEIIELEQKPKPETINTISASSTIARNRNTPNRIISIEEEEQHEHIKALSAKLSKWALPPKCLDASEVENFSELEELLFPSHQPSALNPRDQNSSSKLPNARSSRNIVCCISVLYKYDTTSFRTSEIIDDLQDQQMRLCENSLGIILYPTESKVPYYIPLQEREQTHSSEPNLISASISSRKQLLQSLIESEDIEKVSFGFQEVLQALMFHDISISCKKLFDIQIASWVWNPELPSYSFSALQEKFLQPPKNAISSKISSGSISTSTNISKTTEDCIGCLRLHRVLMHQLNLQELRDSFEGEMRVVHCMAKMEYKGVCFNAEVLNKHKKQLLLRKQQLLGQAQQMLHRKVILSSPPDVATALYSDLKLPKPKQRSWQQKRKKNEKSDDPEALNETYWEGCTKDSVLQKLSELHDFPKLVLEYRKCKILLSNWIDSLPSKAILDPITKQKIIYTHWTHTSTSTGRISSQNPNLQSLPKHSLQMDPHVDGIQMNINIRNSFVARPGFVLVAADYSQLEMRILAHVTNDSYLNEFFASEQDIHSMIASRWLDKAIEEVSAIERERSKKIVYGIVYGIGSVSLADMLGVEPSEATKFIHTFLDKFPDIKTWTEQVVYAARKSKMVRTLTNRRRLLPLINSKDRAKKKRSERQAINTPIQGTASDIAKIAMYKIDEQISRLSDDIRNPVAHLLMNIHDELVYEVSIEHKENIIEMIKDQMEDSVCLTTSIPVCVFEGKSFGEMKKIEFEEKSPFLLILKKDNSPYLVTREDKVSCIMSTNPLNPGHCVVVPNEPVEEWEKIPGDILSSLMDLCKKVAGYLRILYPECVRVLLQSGSSQLRHAHFHVLPILKGDVSIVVPNYQSAISSVAMQQQISAEAERIRSLFN